MIGLGIVIFFCYVKGKLLYLNSQWIPLWIFSSDFANIVFRQPLELPCNLNFASNRKALNIIFIVQQYEVLAKGALRFLYCCCILGRSSGSEKALLTKRRRRYVDGSGPILHVRQPLAFTIIEAYIFPTKTWDRSSMVFASQTTNLSQLFCHACHSPFTVDVHTFPRGWFLKNYNTPKNLGLLECDKLRFVHKHDFSIYILLSLYKHTPIIPF